MHQLSHQRSDVMRFFQLTFLRVPARNPPIFKIQFGNFGVSKICQFCQPAIVAMFGNFAIGDSCQIWQLTTFANFGNLQFSELVAMFGDFAIQRIKAVTNKLRKKSSQKQ